MKNLLLWLLICGFGLATHGQADRSIGRSIVMSTGGIVASEHPLASQAGATILAQGGNAIDALVAANAMMSVVSPMMCGMGGDLFAIIYEAKSGQIIGLNASGWAPQGLSIAYLSQKGITNMPQAGIHSVTVPGAVAGWDKLLHRFGRTSFATVLAPAIHCAEEGYPVSELVSGAWGACSNLLSRDDHARKTFMPNGHPPVAGEIFHNPDLSWSLRQVASNGCDAFYRGAIAERLLRTSSRLGGTLAATDLTEFSAEWVQPISTTYRGWRVYEIPPNGQGIAALMMLNVMEQFPLAEYGFQSADTLHIMIEAKKLAYADLLRYVADPHFSRVPTTELLAKTYAANRARSMDLKRAQDHPEFGKPNPMGNDTTYLCAVDREGNMVSLIQSLYNGFGSGLVVDGAGFALQNRGGLFRLDPNHPNALAGHKRPLHTIIPALMEKDQVRIAFGIMGGWNQAQAHAQFVSHIADFNLGLQAAIEAPRFTKMTFEGCDVQVERRLPENTRNELTQRGHVLQIKGDFTQAVGGGQAVKRDFKSGVNYGASDPRKDGAAIPETIRTANTPSASH